jgi:hypothetical protein
MLKARPRQSCTRISAAKKKKTNAKGLKSDAVLKMSKYGSSISVQNNEKTMKQVHLLAA